MKIILEEDGALNVYADGQFLLGLPAASMQKTLQRAEEPVRAYFDKIGGRRDAAELAHRVMRLYYTGVPGEYEVSK